MNIRDIFTVATAYIRGFLCVRIFKIDLNLYQSGHLHGAWSLKALKKHNGRKKYPLRICRRTRN